MNIEHILHPEILLSMRGSNPDRDFYGSLMGALSLDEEKREYRIYLDAMKNREASEYLQRCMQIPGGIAPLDLMKRWVSSKQQVFYIPKNFCEALSSVQKNIKVQYLPDEFICFLAFPKDKYLSPKGSIINGVYIRLTSSSGTAENSCNMKLQLCFVSSIRTPGQGPISILVDLSDGQTVYESMVKSLARYRDLIDSLKEIINVSVNALLFIHHEVAEIKKLIPAVGLSRTNRNLAKEAQGGVGNLCTLPISILSFDYHDRQRTFTVESTRVRGHFRWQPYGTGFTKLKLAWISEHERHYLPIAISNNPLAREK